MKGIGNKIYKKEKVMRKSPELEKQKKQDNQELEETSNRAEMQGMQIEEQEMQEEI
jgi:hypothetical protein